MVDKRPVSIGVDNNCRVRPAKNFLGVLGRATRRLGIRQEENIIQRAARRLHPRKACLDGTSLDVRGRAS